MTSFRKHHIVYIHSNIKLQSSNAPFIVTITFLEPKKVENYKYNAKVAKKNVMQKPRKCKITHNPYKLKEFSLYALLTFP